MSRPILRACALALASLIALWAFVSYLQPEFSGEQAGATLICS